MGAAPPPPPKPGAKRRKRGGCRCCCLALLLGPVVVLLVVLLVSWLGPRLKKDPVEEEWKSIPDYFGAGVEATGRAPRA